MQKKSEKIVFTGQWIKVKEAEFINNAGQNIKWEYIERNSHKKLIVVLAQITPAGKFILIRQFRPALNSHVIGLPAGIVNEDDLESAALKELQEETGSQNQNQHRQTPDHPVDLADKIRQRYHH